MSRTLVTETVVYKLDELDPPTQQQAHQKWQEHNLGYEWWEFTYDNAKRIGKILGIEIENIGFSGFWSQGDGAHFEGYYQYEKGSVANVIKECPQDEELHGIARRLQKIQKKFFYKLRAGVKHRGHYQHSGCTSIEVEYYDDRYRDIGNAEDDIKDELRTFMDWIYKSLEKEYEFLQSFEQFKESAEANEYEFDSEGVRV